MSDPARAPPCCQTGVTKLGARFFYHRRLQKEMARSRTTKLTPEETTKYINRVFPGMMKKEIRRYIRIDGKPINECTLTRWYQEGIPLNRIETLLDSAQRRASLTLRRVGETRNELSARIAGY